MENFDHAIASLRKLRHATPSIGDLRLGGLDRPLSTAEQIADRMAEDLISGQILPGEWLREALLAERFSVSRGPVREALRILEANGMIQFHKNRGASVPTLSGNDLWQIRVISEAVGRPNIDALARNQNEMLGEELLLTAEFVHEHAATATPTTFALQIAVQTLCRIHAGVGPIMERLIRQLFYQTLRFTVLGCQEAEHRKAAARLLVEQAKATTERDIDLANDIYINVMANIHDRGWNLHRQQNSSAQ